MSKLNLKDHYIDFKNNQSAVDIISLEPTEQVTSLDSIVINLFTCQKLITGLLKARENILSQSNSGKRGYYTFSYPGLGWVQYDHNSIQTIYKLATKSKFDLYKITENEKFNVRLRLHAMAAFIIKNGDSFYDLYNGIAKAIKFTKDNRLVYITFANPFYGIISSSMNTKKYSGEELVTLHNIGMSRRFKSIFP
jgi:hypothetical protein